MRVTELQLQRTALLAINDNRVRLQGYQKQALTGLRVENPSDDPAAAARARLLGGLLTANRSHQTNISYGDARLAAAETALSEAGTALIRARELATAMANETYSAEDRRLTAIEVEELRKQLVDLVNTTYGDEYVFANVDASQPVVDASGVFTYDANIYTDVRRVEIGPNETGEIGSSGSLAFAQRAADPNSVDVINTIADLLANLNANDVDGVRANVDTITQALDQTIAERARVGSRMQRLQVAQVSAEQDAALVQELRADLVEVDIAEAYSRLSTAETAVRAAVTVASRVLGPSLLDVL
jgi:flagellar hook-associated protein 3 FlgL